MKKGLNWVLSVCLVIGLVIVFTGCAGSSAVTKFQDTSIPWQEHAMLSTFFGQRIMKGPKTTLVSVDDTFVIPAQTNKIYLIPPGTHTIIISTEVIDNFGNTYPVNKTVTYEFQPGGRYVVYGTVLDNRYLMVSADTEIYTLDDFQPVYLEQKTSTMYSSEELDKGGYSFEDFVLARFEKAKAALSK